MRDNNAFQRPRSDFFLLSHVNFPSQQNGDLGKGIKVRVRKTSIEHAQMCLCFV